MSAHQLAAEYARALHEGAPDHTQPAAAAFRRLGDSLAADRSLRRFVATPGIAPGEKVAVLARLAGTDLPEAGRHALQRLVGSGSVGLCAEIGRELLGLARKASGVSEVTVRSAAPLSGSQRTRLVQALERRTGGAVVLAEEVDPELIAGLSVRIGDLLMDNTVKGELTALREQLTGAAHGV